MKILLRRWRAWHIAILCALRDQEAHGPPAAMSALKRDSQWALATNDQFALAQLLTPTHAHVALAGLKCLTLSSRFNWRGRECSSSDAKHRGSITKAAGQLDGRSSIAAAASAADGPIVVRHDGARKTWALRGGGQRARGGGLLAKERARQWLSARSEAAWKTICPHGEERASLLVACNSSAEQAW